MQNREIQAFQKVVPFNDLSIHEWVLEAGEFVTREGGAAVPAG
jgi:hypothetical protein